MQCSYFTEFIDRTQVYREDRLLAHSIFEKEESMTRLYLAKLKCWFLSVVFAVVLVASPSFVSAQSNRPTDAYSVPEPLNIGILQDSVRSYVKSGAYERGVTEVIDSARSYIESHYKSVVHPAIVLDIDETSLSNLEFEYRYNFGYNHTLWNKWVAECLATPIKPTLELAKWAAQRHIAIFFIAGRTQLSSRLSNDPTVRNLRKVGYPKWAGLYFKDAKRKMTIAEFKTSVRKEIAARGYTIVANISDQYSDLIGGYSEASFKLPDPMYFTP
jgi:predicted secreted acid phosphatase